MRLFAGQLLMCLVAGLTFAGAQAPTAAPDLSDAEILQVARHVRAGRPLAEEQQAVVKKVNEMPEVKQLAAHQKAYQAEDEAVRDSILKAHHLDPKKWTVDMQGQRIVPVQAALPPTPPVVTKQ